MSKEFAGLIWLFPPCISQSWRLCFTPQTHVFACGRGLTAVHCLTPPPPRDESYIAVTFQLTEWFRGGLESTLVVRTYPANNSCTYPFEAGHDYLVFAYMKDGNLRTDHCAGTRPIASEIGLIYQLRSAREGRGMADVFGMSYLHQLDSSFSGLEKYEGVSGLTVTAKEPERLAVRFAEILKRRRQTVR